MGKYIKYRLKHMLIEKDIKGKSFKNISLERKKKKKGKKYIY